MTMPTLAGTENVLRSSRSQLVRYASLAAVAGPVSFFAAWFALGVLQPVVRGEYGWIGGFSGAVTNPISALGVGPHARLFNCAFVICGLMTLAGTMAAMQQTRRNSGEAGAIGCAALLSLSPLGLVMAGMFTLATSLLMHNVAALLVFLAPLVAFPVSARYFRRIPEWRRFGNDLVAAGPLTLVLLVLFVATFHRAAVVAGSGVAGLMERILLVEIHGWYVTLGCRAFRE